MNTTNACISFSPAGIVNWFPLACTQVIEPSVFFVNSFTWVGRETGTILVSRDSMDEGNMIVGYLVNVTIAVAVLVPVSRKDPAGRSSQVQPGPENAERRARPSMQIAASFPPGRRNRTA